MEESKSKKEAQRCLLCERTANLRRGLCVAHYQVYLREKKKAKNSGNDQAFEEAAVRQGIILADGRSSSVAAGNIFAELRKGIEAGQDVERRLRLAVEEHQGKVPTRTESGQIDGV